MALLRQLFLCLAVAFVWLLPLQAATMASAQPVPLIVDTDIYSDVDDIGALAVANALHDLGEANFLAVLVNSPSRWGAPAAAVINQYYGNSVSVGTLHPVNDDEPMSVPPIADWATADWWLNDLSKRTANYPRFLATNFPNGGLSNGAGAEDAVATYRRILASQADHSVVIASIGAFTNLANLLSSGPDSFSPLPGRDLVALKVKQMVAMAGTYPFSKVEENSNVEFNIALDVESAKQVVAEWPTPIVFHGSEVGGSIDTGSSLSAKTPAENPVRKAYEIYLDADHQPDATNGYDGGGKSRNSWDLATIYYAVRGPAGLFETQGNGQVNEISDDSHNAFVAKKLDSDSRDHQYVVKVATDDQISAVLEALLVQPPKSPPFTIAPPPGGTGLPLPAIPTPAVAAEGNQADGGVSITHSRALAGNSAIEAKSEFGISKLAWIRRRNKITLSGVAANRENNIVAVKFSCAKRALTRTRFARNGTWKIETRLPARCRWSQKIKLKLTQKIGKAAPTVIFREVKFSPGH